MNTNDQREEIKDVQAECEMHWLANSVPGDRSEEMADELGQHLEEAVKDGKTVEDVVGPDVSAFAESLAKEERPVWTVRDRVMKYVWALTFQAAFFAVAFHILTWTLHLPVNWVLIPYLLYFSWPLSRLVLRPELSDTRPRWRSWLWLGAAVLLIATVWFTRDEVRVILEGINVALTGNVNGTLFTWPWYATLVLVVLNALIGRLKK